MKSTKPVTPFAPHEIRRFISPLTVTSVIILAVVIIESLLENPESHLLLVVFGIIGIAYITIAHILIVRSTFRIGTYKLLNSTLAGIGLGILSFLMPQNAGEVLQVLIIFGVVVIATIAGRSYAYLTLLLFVISSLPSNYIRSNTVEAVLEYTTPFLVSIMVVEVIIRIKDTTQQHIHRLETINRVSRQIMQTLDTEKTLSLLDATIQDALDADTYFIGIVRNDRLQLELFYDDGEYFNGTNVPMEGTLSGWVIQNQKELFLPDMREEVTLEGVEHFIIGKEKTSLSWIGVPLKAENVTGVLALASYTANAFDRADLELLVSLGQHVTLALDNTIRHAQVERQARLDSLTGVYNHGYFLKMLAEQAEESLQSQKPLSLIMLDIDYFKQYNDTYGHLVGDRILNSLCDAIKHNIKQTDAVGRWGGEEFIISLPGATGPQAIQIARRISETLMDLRVVDRDHQAVPIPTVSQGIAVHPNEADEIYRLIDLADKRLYIAKARGRNQVEPGADIWRE
jgi:diguanylate cyclase (GGDEF)-like protein